MMQLRLSEGQEAGEKRQGYKRALALAYAPAGQPDRAIPLLQELLEAAIAPEERLQLLCRLADAQVRFLWHAARVSGIGNLQVG
jgi:hypothetical protein